MKTESSALHELTIEDASAMLANGEVSSVELTEAILHRVLETEPLVHAYVTVLGEQALQSAREADAADRSDSAGLHGIPLSLKDLFDVAGVVTTAGSRSRRDSVATSDSTVAARLREARAVITGKTVMHEFAFGVTSPPARNPWDPTRIPGGSSGGAGASVAAGSSLGAFGTDTGCSIRLPAALNGVVGLKPTFGRVGRGGVVSLSWAHDHAGPIARTVTDCGLLLEAVAGLDPRDPGSVAEPPPTFDSAEWSDAAGLRIGVPEQYFFEDLQPDVDGAVRAAIQVLDSLGAEVIEVRVPAVEHSLPVVLVSSLVEGASLHRTGLDEAAALFGDEVRGLLKAGSLVLATDYVDAQRARSVITQSMRRTFEENKLDLLATPTAPMTALPVGQELYGDPPEPLLNHYARLCCPFNITGQPALSVPCGYDRDGLPIGLQLVGRPFDEATVLRAGHVYERATAWHQRRPRIALMR